MIDHGSGARAPDGTGRDLKQRGRVIARKFEGVAPFDEAQALGDQAFELDGFYFGAVLFGLAAALRLLVDVELALECGRSYGGTG